MFSPPFRSLLLKFTFIAVVWGPACSGSEDPAEEESGIGASPGRGGSAGKPGNKGGKSGKGGSGNAEAGTPGDQEEGGSAGVGVIDPPGGSETGGSAGAGTEPEPGSGGSTGGTESGTGGTHSTAGDTGTGSAGEPGEEPGTGGTGMSGTGGTGEPGGTGGSAGRPTEEPDTEAILRGKALAEENVCVACHQDDYSGLGFYPNLTSDMETGLGSWSDTDIANAIQNGYDKNGETLCNLMTMYPFTNEETMDVVKFLRSLPPVSNQITAVCPGHGQ